MTDDTANHTLEMLRRIDNRLTDLTGEMRANRRSMDSQFAEIRHQLSTFSGYQTTRDQDIADLRARVELLENRLNLAPVGGQ